MDMFRIYSAEDLNTLPSGVWGIREPDLDICIRVLSNVHSVVYHYSEGDEE